MLERLEHHILHPLIPGHNYIGTEHILLGLLREGEGVAARVLETLGADPAKIRTQVIRMVGESQETVGSTVGGGASGSNKTPTLEEYGTNLTTLAEEVLMMMHVDDVATTYAQQHLFTTQLITPPTTGQAGPRGGPQKGD